MEFLYILHGIVVLVGLYAAYKSVYNRGILKVSELPIIIIMILTVFVPVLNIFAIMVMSDIDPKIFAGLRKYFDYTLWERKENK
jgi:hypothetical protein